MAHLIADIVRHTCDLHHNLTAVSWKERKQIVCRTYAELDHDIALVRGFLNKEDLVKKHVVLVGPTSYEWITTYLALTTNGCTAVPLDAGLPAEELLELVERADAEAVFASPAVKEFDALVRSTASAQSGSRCPMLKKVFSLDGELLGQIRECGVEEVGFATDVKADDVCTIIFTSGTTGKSKGVCLTQQNLTDNVMSLRIDVKPGGVLLSVLPIHHAYCLTSDWLAGMYYGANIAINDSLLRMVKNMTVFNPDMMLMVPLMIETIYKKLQAVDSSIPKNIVKEQIFGPNLKTIFSGGAHLDPFYANAFKEYGIVVSEGYGMSECSPTISMNGMNEDEVVPGSVGKPLENVEVKFVDGELLVRGSSVMKEYYKMPVETAETIVDGWLHTGDLAHLDENGYLFITGRVKNLIILSNGENISPEEIENKLALNPLIGEVIVTGKNNVLTAHVYPDQDVVEFKKLDETTIAAEIQKAIDAFNLSQPGYRRLTRLDIRTEPFIKSSTRKIKRALVEA